MLFTICFEFQVSAARQLAVSNQDLIVAAEPYPPYLVLTKDDNGTAIWSGLMWDFLEYIREARNCSFRLVRPRDGKWGNCYDSNNCTGMIGQVNRKEVDFALGLLSKLYIKSRTNH